MSINANKVLLVGSVVSLKVAGTSGRVTLEVPAGDGERDDQKTTQLQVMFRNVGDVKMTPLLEGVKEGDAIACECQFYDQEVTFDGKDKAWKINMLEAKPGKVAIFPGGGINLRAMGNGINTATFAGRVMKNEGVKKVGAKETAMLRLNVLCEPTYDKQRSKEDTKKAEKWIDLTAWRGLAEKWLYKAEKGDLILVTGPIMSRPRDGQVFKGVPVPQIEIEMKEVHLQPMGKGGGSSSGNGSGGSSAGGVDDDLPF